MDRLTQQLEADIMPNVNVFKGLINEIPEKYLLSHLKKNIIKNKENDANRIINA